MKTSSRGYLYLSVFVCLGGFLASCGKTSSPSDVQAGSVSGVTVLVDSVGNRLSTSAGVSVSLDGSNYTTQTDSAGFWEIGNVSPGNYNVTVSKTGFGLIRAYGVTIEGPGMAYVSPQMTLGIAPSTVPVLSNVVIAPRKDSGVVTNDSLLSGDYSGGVNMFFIDNSPNVQPAMPICCWSMAQKEEIILTTRCPISAVLVSSLE
jgi:hypothetical protein